MSERSGVVKWFADDKGFGFIVPDQDSGAEKAKDIFFHYSGICGKGRRTLHEGDKVIFNVIQGEKGPQAVDVTVTA